ncbi:MAG: hypothetical protein H7829_01860 [Magnetococcus sp. THC-1_WYH]
MNGGKIKIIFKNSHFSMTPNYFPDREPLPDVMYADDLYFSSDEGIVFNIVEPIRARFRYFLEDLEWLIKEEWISPCNFKYYCDEALEFIVYFQKQYVDAVGKKFESKSISLEQMKKLYPWAFSEKSIQDVLSKLVLNNELTTLTEWGKKSADARWSPMKMDIGNIVAMATERWEIGCPFDHAKMAEFLFNLWKEKKQEPNFKIGSLRKKIKGIAPKDKIRGLGGVKANPTSPKRICKTCLVKNPQICKEN